MANNDHPLTDRQISILEAINDGAEYNIPALTTKKGATHNGQEASKLGWNIDRLVSRQMVEIVSTVRPRAFVITQHGKTSLREVLTQRRLYGGIVAPARIGLLSDRPPYVPPKAYYRNSGHPDIQSRGVRC